MPGWLTEASAASPAAGRPWPRRRAPVRQPTRPRPPRPPAGPSRPRGVAGAAGCGRAPDQACAGSGPTEAIWRSASEALGASDAVRSRRVEGSPSSVWEGSVLCLQGEPLYGRIKKGFLQDEDSVLCLRRLSPMSGLGAHRQVVAVCVEPILVTWPRHLLLVPSRRSLHLRAIVKRARTGRGERGAGVSQIRHTMVMKEGSGGD